ncbi:YadA-like family protein [Actinobacillus equuli subsp. haemolyticus]|uniref:YadA-like family protein n=1 Tax=Actinobacillus equuli TaxID=718 RepID=UPI0024466A32|nr:YadA-like family protein [Actinobacillus equuli]WGE50074.1 YadA-like family protein [Actinobacillus equuli subsp. haemolyticus]
MAYGTQDNGTSPYNYYNPGSLSYEDPSSAKNQNNFDNNLSFGIAIGNHTNVLQQANNGNKKSSNGIAIGDYAKATGGLAIAVGAFSQATDVGAVALGAASRASGFNSLAMMRQSAATGNYATAIGSVSYAKGNASFAMGASATAFGNQSIAIGSVSPTTTNGGQAPVTTYDAMNRTQTNGDRSMALGSGAKTSGDDSFAIGSNAETGTFKTSQWVIKDANKTTNQTEANTTAARAIAFGSHAKARKDEAIAFGTNATALSNASIAFGNKANVTGNVAIAFGNESVAIGETSIAFGKKANATGKSAIAFGADANATGNFTLAVGDKANAKGNMSMALGLNATTTGESSIAFGANSNATAMNATAFGTRANASANFTLALGDNAKASALNATAIGNLANASANFTLAMGTEAKASAINATAIGHFANATGNMSTAFGTKAHTKGESAFAMGTEANASANYTLALGHQANASAINATAIGHLANATGNMSTAFGTKAHTKGESAFAMGTEANASANYTLALGTKANATAVNATAIGHLANATGNMSAAFGTQAKATKENATAFGTKARAEGESAFAMGTEANANATNTIALGTKANATAVNATAIGHLANATGNMSTAFGTKAHTKGESAFAMGTEANASANYTLALGTKANATAVNATAIGHLANATGNMSTAFGTKAHTKGESAFAMGTEANANANNTIALGTKANATAINATAIGYLANAIGNMSAAFGTNSNAKGESAFAMGTEANASANFTLALGHQANASAINATAIGKEAKASNNYTIALGTKANATAVNATAIGHLSDATGNMSAAFGTQAKATKENATAFGTKASASGLSAIAFGSEANSSANFTIAMGNKAHASANFTLALGHQANASAINATAIGNLANATKENATAFGTKASASGISAIAFGSEANSSANFTIAMGNKAHASANYTIALGDSAKSSAINATAIGYKANASVNHSVALGFNSTTTAGQDTNSATVNGLTYSGFAGNKTFSVVSVGSKGQERQIQHVAAGNISATSTDAINGSQLYLTQQTLGNVANSLNITLGGNSKVHPNGTVKITNIGNTGKNNIHDAIMAVNNSVEAGKNTNVTAKKNDSGNITYTVNAWNTTVQGINDVNVTGVVDNANYTLNYTVDLSESAKNNITLANTTAHNANATVNKGWNITTNKTGTGTVTGNDKQHNVKMGTTITLIAGDNINISQDSANITIATSKTPTFTQITVGQNTSITDEGLKITGGPSITKTGIDAGNKVITNVANGTNGTDAVNLNQLNASRSFVVEGKNTNITSTSNENGTTYTVNSWNTTVKAGSKEVNVTESIDKTNYTISYQFDLSDSAKQNITNANTTAHIANNTVNKGWNITTSKSDGNVSNSTKHNVKMGDTVTIDAGKNINISQNGSNITIATSDKPTFTQITVGSNTTITDDGLKIKNGPSITLNGIDAGDKKITNVSNGDLSANSKDAVNGSQLYATNQNVTKNANNIANNTATIAKGFGLQAQDGQNVTKKLGEKIDVVGGNSNINTTVTAGKIQINLNNTLNLTKAGSITIGNTTLNNDGLKITNGPSITQNGINAGNKVITNVAEGVNGTDAVNLNQLQKVNATANAGWKLQANHANSSTVKPNHTVSLNNTDGNIIISKATDDHNVTFGLNHTITIGGPNKPGNTQGKDGSLTVNSADGKSGVSLNGKDGSIGLNGKDGENATISIAKGADGLDGKNGTNGKTRITYHTPNGDKEEVATLNDGLNFVGDDGKVVAKKLNQTLTIKGNLSKEASVTDQNLRVDNHNGELIIKMAKSLRDLANATFVDGANSTVIDGNGLIISGGPSITRHGINAGNRVITNVTAGVNGTDAVNVDQLKQAAAAATTTLENSNTTTVQSHLGKNGQPVYRVEVNKAPITVNNDGMAAVKAPDGTDVNNSFATVGDVVNALNNVSWTIQGNGETKDQVTAGNKVNFINGNGTTAVVNTNADKTVTNVSFNVNTSSMAFNSTSGKIDVGDSNGFATAGDVAKAIKDAELTSTVVAGNNLEVSSTVNGNNTEFKVSLSNNLDLTDQGSVKIGDTTLNKDGLKVGDTSVSKDGVKVGDINITKDGINAGGKKITNLANGTEATDAVNLSQLKASTAAAKTELTNGTTTTVNSVQGKDGQTIYSVEVNKAPVTVNSTTGIAETSANPTAAKNSFATVSDVVNALNNVSWSVNSTAVVGTNGVSSYQQTNDSKISAGDSVNYKAGQNIVLSGSGNNLVIATNPDSTFDSVTAKNQVTVGSVNIASNGKISGVADGDISPISTEAVNGSQLYATHQNIADYLGGNASLDANGALQAPTYTINKTDGTTVTAHNVGDALGHLNNEVIKPLTFAGDIGTPSERPLGSTIALTGGVTEESQLSDNNIGVTSDGKGTINVKLAKDIKVNSVNANTVTVGDTKIDSDGISIHNGPSVTKSGINAAGNKITNVKAGEADTDAVNVSQLKGVANNINNRINAVNNKVDRIDQNLRAGVASAIASGSLYHVTLPGKSMLAAGVGTYKGQSAIAVGYSRLSDNGKIGVKVSVNSNTRGDTGAGASIGYQW